METKSCKEQASAQLGTKTTEINEEHGIDKSLATPTPEKPAWSSKAKIIASLARKQLTEEFLNEEDIDGSATDTDSLVSDTSEESASSNNILHKDKSVELPEKYKVLVDFFNQIETSIRLLGLRKLLPTFSNICRQVEVLTKRRLLYRHIAQMKYIFPEAFLIEKILLHNQESLLIIPDMKITLLKNIIVKIPYSHQSVHMVLCETFRARILNFFLSHPEGNDIPEAGLPEPFNQRDLGSPIKNCTEAAGVKLPLEPSSEFESFSNASHLSFSFQKRFFQKHFTQEEHETQLPDTVDNALESFSNRDEIAEDGTSQRLDTSSRLIIKSPARVKCSPSSCTVSRCFESTPAKSLPHFPELIADTPAQQIPKRPVPTPQQILSPKDEELITEARLIMSARRSLMYSPTNNEAGHNQVIETTQSSNQYGSVNRSLWFKEVKGYDKPISDMQHNTERSKDSEDNKHYEMLACLLGTFEAIFCISQSISCSLITKEELVHKILSINLEIEETRQVEEHLHFLEHLFPDWICKQEAMSDGQYLYSIKRTSKREALRAKLVEAA